MPDDLCGGIALYVAACVGIGIGPSWGYRKHIPVHMAGMGGTSYFNSSYGGGEGAVSCMSAFRRQQVEANIHILVGRWG